MCGNFTGRIVKSPTRLACELPNTPSEHKQTLSNGFVSFIFVNFALLFEAVLESAPQFIIQLFAISVQDEPAAIMQIISLPISFLNQAWAFTTTDKRSLAVHEIIPSSGYLNVKHQLALYELSYFCAVDCSPSVISPSATSGWFLGC